MLWHARDTFQLMTLGYDGVLTEGPLYANPATLEEDAENASCVVSLATDTNGEAWMFYTMVWNEGERVVPYIRPLSAFALQ